MSTIPESAAAVVNAGPEVQSSVPAMENRVYVNGLNMDW